MDGSIALSRRERKTLLQYYRKSTDPAVRLRAHILLLLADGHSWPTITRMHCTSPSTIARWRGWNIVLFLDRGSPHTAQGSRRLAAESGMEIRWLPTTCPQFNPVEDLWRWLKGTVLANHQADDFGHTLSTATNAVASLTNHETKQLTGLLSGNFWIPT